MAGVRFPEEELLQFFHFLSSFLTSFPPFFLFSFFKKVFLEDIKRYLKGAERQSSIPYRHIINFEVM